MRAFENRPDTVVIDCSTAVPTSTERVAQAVHAAGGRFLLTGLSGAEAQLQVTMLGYRPVTRSVRVGDTVVWDNRSSVPEGHTVTGDGWASEILGEGGRYTRRFEQPGRYPYRCLPHPQMTGVVIVE